MVHGFGARLGDESKSQDRMHGTLEAGFETCFLAVAWSWQTDVYRISLLDVCPPKEQFDGVGELQRIFSRHDDKRAYCSHRARERYRW